MLLELRVTDFAIIDELHIEFRPGFNIISGETGTGKSVLLRALSLLMGQKSSPELIRSGAKAAVVEGIFDINERDDVGHRLTEMGIPFDEEKTLLVRRVLSEDKSKVYLNGHLSSVQSLRDLISPLIDLAAGSAPLLEMTGQFESRHLLAKSYHLELVDLYAGAWEERQKFNELFSEQQNRIQALQKWQMDNDAFVAKLDFLKFQRDELKELAVDPEADSRLETEIAVLKQSSRLKELLETLDDALFQNEDSVQNRLSFLIKKISDLRIEHTETSAFAETLSATIDGLSEGFYSLHQALRKQLGEDCLVQLDEKEARLSRIRKLEKKHNCSRQELSSLLTNFEQQIYGIENKEIVLEKMRTEIEQAKLVLKKKSTELHKKRLAASEQLAQSVNLELRDLNMKGVQFLVQCKASPELGPFGATEIEFMSHHENSSEDAKPLAKFASGGELSRILLALKKVNSKSKWPRTYLFDEVDTGVSGETAAKVGKKLLQIAKGSQVLCVTHLPQVAAWGQAHFRITKKKTKMQVEELSPEDRVQEIARLISGEKITATSLAHAKALLRSEL